MTLELLIPGPPKPNDRGDSGSYIGEGETFDAALADIRRQLACDGYTLEAEHAFVTLKSVHTFTLSNITRG